MLRLRRRFAFLSVSALLIALSFAQTSSETSGGSSSELIELSRKIDQQNMKIDLLSQQILKLQQEIEHPKPSFSLEGAPRATEVASPIPAGSNTHIVAKGETLTSIARMHKVSVEELQKFNHIENDRKLQIGQTLVLPPGPSPAAATSPSPSPSASPNE
jgi:N-acetylmuramoyl-L-alanine amidase